MIFVNQVLGYFNLGRADYNNICLCETLDDIKMLLSATECDPYLQNGELHLILFDSESFLGILVEIYVLWFIDAFLWVREVVRGDWDLNFMANIAMSLKNAKFLKGFHLVLEVIFWVSRSMRRWRYRDFCLRIWRMLSLDSFTLFSLPSLRYAS